MSANWTARFGLSSWQYQQAFNKYLSDGFRLSSISGYPGSGGPYFAAVWEKASGPDWVTHHVMSAQSYQEHFDEYTSRGFRLLRVSGYEHNGEPHFAAIWENSSGPDGATHHVMTPEQYQDRFDAYLDAGFRLVDLSSYAIGTQPYFAAIWEKSSGPDWVAHHNMTRELYQKYFDKYIDAGFRLMQVSGYGVDGQPHFAAFWEKSSGPAQVSHHVMTAELFQQLSLQYIATGHRLVQVSGYSLSDQPYFAAIWEKSSSTYPKWGSAIANLIKRKSVGYAYAVAKDGMVVERGRHGYARARWEVENNAVKMTYNSRMPIASVSKAITAVAFLHLIEGPDFDDWLARPFSRYLRQVCFWGKHVETVTFRDLLVMRSGMHKFDDEQHYGSYWDEMRRWCEADADKDAIGRGAMDYSNYNYAVLQAIIENISGLSYAEYVRKNVFRPLGMTRMSDEPPAAPYETLAYATTDLTERRPGHSFPKMEVATSSGGWVGPVSDLIKFLIGVRYNAVLSEEVGKTMLEEMIGWFVSSDSALPYRGMNGILPGADGRGLNTAIVHFEDGYDAVILINTAAADDSLWQPETLTAVHGQLSR